MNKSQELKKFRDSYHEEMQKKQEEQKRLYALNLRDRVKKSYEDLEFIYGRFFNSCSYAARSGESKLAILCYTDLGPSGFDYVFDESLIVKLLDMFRKDGFNATCEFGTPYCKIVVEW